MAYAYENLVLGSTLTACYLLLPLAAAAAHLTTIGTVFYHHPLTQRTLNVE